MINLDGSILPAIVIFLTLIFILNRILFRPLLEVQAEREKRTAGRKAEAGKQLAHQSDLFRRYHETIRNARLEGYRLQEQARSEALKRRAEALDRARIKAEELTRESRESLREQVRAAREQIGREADGMARSIAERILGKPV